LIKIHGHRISHSGDKDVLCGCGWDGSAGEVNCDCGCCEGDWDVVVVGLRNFCVGVEEDPVEGDHDGVADDLREFCVCFLLRENLGDGVGDEFFWRRSLPPKTNLEDRQKLETT
jgi:hypothetical protein